MTIEDLAQSAQKAAQKGDYDTAIQLCSNFIEFEENSQALALLEKYQLAKTEQTQSIVDAALAKSSDLWENKQYEKLQILLLKLRKMAPDNKRVESDLIKLRGLTRTRIEQEQQKFNLDAEERIKHLWNKGEYRQVLKASREIIDVDPNNAFASTFEIKAKKAAISAAITEIKNNYFKKGDFRSAMHALSQLSSEFGHTRELLAASREFDAAMLKDIRAQQDKHIEEGLVRAKKSMDAQNLSDALLLVRELESIDQKHDGLQKFKKKLMKAFSKETDKEIDAYLSQKRVDLEADFVANSEDYISL